MRRRLHDGMMAGKAARVEKLGYWDFGHRDGDAEKQVRRGTDSRCFGSAWAYLEESELGLT